LNGAGSSAVASGNADLTVPVNFCVVQREQSVFMSGRARSRDRVASEGRNDGGVHVAAVAVIPASGTGPSQTFGLQYSTRRGHDLIAVSVLIKIRQHGRGMLCDLRPRGIRWRFLTDAGASPSSD